MITIHTPFDVRKHSSIPVNDPLVDEEFKELFKMEKPDTVEFKLSPRWVKNVLKANAIVNKQMGGVSMTLFVNRKGEEDGSHFRCKKNAEIIEVPFYSDFDIEEFRQVTSTTSWKIVVFSEKIEISLLFVNGWTERIYHLAPIKIQLLEEVMKKP